MVLDEDKMKLIFKIAKEKNEVTLRLENNT